MPGNFSLYLKFCKLLSLLHYVLKLPAFSISVKHVCSNLTLVSGKTLSKYI